MNVPTCADDRTLSIYKWEAGKVYPRAAQLERIAAIRKLGKREAVVRLAVLQQTE